jgi:hypothetical protein
MTYNTDKPRKEITKSLIESCAEINQPELNADTINEECINEVGEWMDAWAQKELIIQGIGAGAALIMIGVVTAQMGIAKAKAFFKGLKKSKDPKADLKKQVGKDFDEISKTK